MLGLVCDQSKDDYSAAFAKWIHERTIIKLVGLYRTLVQTLERTSLQVLKIILPLKQSCHFIPTQQVSRSISLIQWKSIKNIAIQFTRHKLYLLLQVMKHQKESMNSQHILFRTYLGCNHTMQNRNSQTDQSRIFYNKKPTSLSDGWLFISFLLKFISNIYLKVEGNSLIPLYITQV